MTKHFQTFIRLLLPLIFITYVGGQTWFSHVHRVEQGVIVHAHPYKQKHHTHTPKQFETILFLSHYLLPELTVLEQLLPLPVFHWYCVPLSSDGRGGREDLAAPFGGTCSALSVACTPCGVFPLNTT